MPGPSARRDTSVSVTQAHPSTGLTNRAGQERESAFSEPARRRLKILFVTNWYPTLDEPAKAVWVREHAKAVQLYADVVVLHFAGTDAGLRPSSHVLPETNEVLNEGIPTYRVRHRRSRIPHLSYLYYVRGLFRAYRHLSDQGFRPHIIHAHIYDVGGPAVLLGRRHSIPVVVSEQFSSFPRQLLGPLDLFKAWLAFRWAHRVLPVSLALQRAIETYGIHAHFQVVPNVADTAIFAPPPAREPTLPQRLLFVGQLVPIKGLPYLLHALSALRHPRADWHLDIVGDGHARQIYESLAAELGLSANVSFHGLKTKREVAHLMRGADLFVLPSLCETFSAPSVEALATGLPVLATRCGGPEEFMRDGLGLLVPPGDTGALTEGLHSMLDHLPAYSRHEVAQYARDHFSPEVVGAILHAIYRSLDAPKRSG